MTKFTTNRTTPRAFAEMLGSPVHRAATKLIKSLDLPKGSHDCVTYRKKLLQAEPELLARVLKNSGATPSKPKGTSSKSPTESPKVSGVTK